jgi:hypothetical protein
MFNIENLMNKNKKGKIEDTGFALFLYSQLLMGVAERLFEKPWETV